MLPRKVILTVEVYATAVDQSLFPSEKGKMPTRNLEMSALPHARASPPDFNKRHVIRAESIADYIGTHLYLGLISAALSSPNSGW